MAVFIARKSENAYIRIVDRHSRLLQNQPIPIDFTAFSLLMVKYEYTLLYFADKLDSAVREAFIICI